MGQIRINTERVREVGQQFLSEAQALSDMGYTLDNEIDSLDVYTWDGTSRTRAAPLLDQARPDSIAIAQQLEELGHLLIHVADTFEEEDNAAAGQFDAMGWIQVFRERIDTAIGSIIGGIPGILPWFWQDFHTPPGPRELLWNKITAGSGSEQDLYELAGYYTTTSEEQKALADQFDKLAATFSPGSKDFEQGLEFITSVQPGTIGTSHATPVGTSMQKAGQDFQGGLHNARKELASGTDQVFDSLKQGDFLGAGIALGGGLWSAGGQTLKGGGKAITKFTGNAISFGTHTSGSTTGAAHSLIGVAPGEFVESVDEGPKATLAVDAYIHRKKNGEKIILQEIPDITEAERQNAAEFARDQIRENEKNYDWFGTMLGMQSDDKWYCSELVEASFEQGAGMDVERGQDFTPSNIIFNGLVPGWGDWIDRNRISPHELETATIDGQGLIQTYP